MVQGTFVAATFIKRPEEVIRKVEYRQTSMRYVVVVIAILVVFGCEYCFDTASVGLSNSGTPNTHLAQSLVSGQQDLVGRVQLALLSLCFSKRGHPSAWRNHHRQVRSQDSADDYSYVLRAGTSYLRLWRVLERLFTYACGQSGLRYWRIGAACIAEHPHQYMV